MSPYRVDVTSDPGAPLHQRGEVVDEAVPVRAASLRERRPPTAGWHGEGRRRLLIGAALLGVLPLLVTAIALLRPPERGAETPEGAVEQLLIGLAEADGPAIARVVDPDELREPERASDGYQSLSRRLTRAAEVPPLEIARLVSSLDDTDGLVDGPALALLAAYQGDLRGLRLESARDGDRARVFVRDGLLSVELDPGELSGGLRDRLPAGSTRATYDMEIAEGWRLDDAPTDPYFVVVERDGRWFVSLDATAADLGAS